MNLRGLGLSSAEDEAYRLLVASGATDVTHLAHLAQRPVPAMAATVAALGERGLLSQPGDDPDTVVAVPPDVALAPLLLHGQEALSEASRAIAELTEQHRANARWRDATQLVEVVTGAPAIRQAVRTIQASTRREMLWFCRAGPVAMPTGENEEQYDMMTRGVRYRVVYEQALLEEPGVLADVDRSVAAGEEARALPELPVRLAIADNAVALCPLVPGDRSGRTEPTAAIVRHSNLLTALIALFETHWSAASPLSPSGGQRGATSPVEPRPLSAVSADQLDLLSLLVAGVTDKAIATHAGISVRTVQRRVSELMELTGARSRMQLAWQAAQRGWLSEVEPAAARPPHPASGSIP